MVVGHITAVQGPRARGDRPAAVRVEWRDLAKPEQVGAHAQKPFIRGTRIRLIAPCQLEAMPPSVSLCVCASSVAQWHASSPRISCSSRLVAYNLYDTEHAHHLLRRQWVGRRDADESMNLGRTREHVIHILRDQWPMPPLAGTCTAAATCTADLLRTRVQRCPFHGTGHDNRDAGQRGSVAVRGAVLRNSIPPVDAADIAGEKHCSGVLSQLFSPSRSGLNTNRYRTIREIRDGGFRACSLWDCCV